MKLTSVIKNIIIQIADIIFAPVVLVSSCLLKKVRELGVERLKISKYILLKVGVFPIRDHYYEPQFNMNCVKKDFETDRSLVGININSKKQLDILRQLNCSEELLSFPLERQAHAEFYYNNGAFEFGDSEYWYQLIRRYKPKKIFEIGSGYSTLMAINAIHKNQSQEPNYKCRHVCIEPYEKPWLEDANVELHREKVENIETRFFSELEKDDILFIDSSHVIRPEGDVLYEYLELLPSLNKGVIVHIHDIFTPKNYPSEWLASEVRLWNEQYLVEAFLSNNECWEILGALNYLKHNYFGQLKRVCPLLEVETEPGSLYIQKIK